ncbi:hypothetical protein [Flavobacterium alkalisoli]|uniref:hypothetical protein n=1 Tax=Flavobacterium alkalisoli TaxID=2602769 RepID=UPI003A8D9862
MWTPITLTELNKLIKQEEFDSSVTQLWELIKIEPEKWEETEFGNEGGFWAVAIFGKNVIWYNDIEEGFNISPYKIYGKIDYYYCNQDELKHVLMNLHSHKFFKRNGAEGL